MARLTILAGSFGLAFVAVLTAGAEVAYSADRSDAAALADELNRYADFIGRTLLPEELALLEAARSSERPEIRALSAALLYRADAAKYRSDLESQFSIHDYALRARGETENISQGEFISSVKRLEQTHPSLQPSLTLLVSFVRFRDANLWFPQGSQKVSVSRFFRGAFFAQVFQGSKLDAVAVANELDQEARRQYERDAGSKR